MILNVIWVLLFFLIPVFVIYLCIKFKWLDKIGAVLINYGIGLLLANINVLPENFEGVQNTLTTVLIPLALPLLLFTADIKAWLKMLGKTTTALILGLTALLVAIYSGYFYFRESVDNLWEISAMLVGVYTGGTPNLASIKTALNIDAGRFIITHSSDMFASLIYLVFILAVGQKLMGLLLPKFKKPTTVTNHHAAKTDMIEETESFVSLIKKENLKGVLKALGLSVFIFAVGGGISMLVPEKVMMLTAILTITTLGILFSTLKNVRKLANSFPLGMYFIHVFSLVVASMADLSEFSAIESVEILSYVFWVVGFSILIHFILSYFFKIDVDTFIIVSVSLIFSPPFIPVVASALKNKYVIISGITAGIVGYAIGNYLGVFVALSLK